MGTLDGPRGDGVTVHHGADGGGRAPLRESRRAAPHDFTIRRGMMPMRGIDPMGPKFREILGAWIQAGDPYYRPLPE
jgi:hypothetical protein